MEIKLSELEKLRLEFEKKFATEGCVENHTVYNTDYLSADCTLVDVWIFFIENLPKLISRQIEGIGARMILEIENKKGKENDTMDKFHYNGQQTGVLNFLNAIITEIKGGQHGR